MRLCELPDCGKERPSWGAFCNEHYVSIPSALRRELRKHRQRGQEFGLVEPSPKYRATVRACVDWLTVMVQKKSLPGQGLVS
jgi:hypothetical protein